MIDCKELTNEQMYYILALEVRSMQERIIKVLQTLGIEELKEVDQLWELPGSYINMESKLEKGEKKQVLDNDKMYLCCQVEINDRECYGIAADDKEIVVYKYKNDGMDAEVVKIVQL